MVHEVHIVFVDLADWVERKYVLFLTHSREEGIFQETPLSPFQSTSCDHYHAHFTSPLKIYFIIWKCQKLMIALDEILLT